MRGVYDANIDITTLSSGRTVLYITAPANKVVEILSARIGDATNATNEQWEACWQKVSSLGTPTGTSLTPTKLEQGDQAASSTVVGNVTASEPTYASNTKVDPQGFPCLTGYRHEPQPEERIVIAGGDTWGLRLLTTSPTSNTTVVSVRFREIG